MITEKGKGHLLNKIIWDALQKEWTACGHEAWEGVTVQRQRGYGG